MAPADFGLPEFKPENLTSNGGAKLFQGADPKGENRFLTSGNEFIKREGVLWQLPFV
jgi:hypothetical protein